MIYRVSNKWNKKTRDFIRAIIDTIIDNKGEILPEYGAQIDLIAINYEIILDADKDMKKNGMFITNRFGDKIANPAIKVLNDAQIQLQKLLNEFNLTKKSRIKLSGGDEGGDDNYTHPAILNAVNNFKGKIEKR